MSILTSEAQKHLDNMSELDMNSILEWIRNRPPINPFVVYHGYMYFFKGETLVCVEIKEQNGVFILWFDNKIIKFAPPTGNCVIVSFSRNCWEYFSVDNHYQNATQNGLHCFLYKLLIQERINRIGGRTIRSIQFFFTPNSVVIHLERARASTLKVPDDCLSIYEMICGIKQLLITQINYLFLRRPNFFLPAILDVQRTQCPLSVSGKYGVRLFLQTQFDRRLPAFSMISLLMEKLIPNHLMSGGTLQKRVAMKFLRAMFSLIFPNLCMTFTQNLIGFQQAIPRMDQLFDGDHLKSKLVSNGFPSSISGCVEDMMGALQVREEASAEASAEQLMREFNEYHRLEEEKRQREVSIQEFRDGIKQVNTEFQITRTLVNKLSEVCEGSHIKKPRIE